MVLRHCIFADYTFYTLQMKRDRHPKSRRRRNRTLIILLLIIALLVIIRIVLPRVVLHFANKTLSELDGYTGHIYDIDLSLYHGAYKIDSMYIHKIDSLTNNTVPLFEASLIDMAVSWSALFDGKVAAEIKITNPKVIFTKGKSDPKDLQKDTTDFKKVLDGLMPLKINKFEILNGSVHYRDESTSPVLDVKMDQLNVLAQNLSSVRDTSLLPASIRATANVYKGTLAVNVKLDPLADDPTFDLNAELQNTSLPEFNEFFQAYGDLDVNSGIFGLYAEVAAKDRKFTGYVKPVIKDLDVLGPEDKKENFLQKLWEGAAGAVSELFENQRKDQVATKVPLEGSFDNTVIGTWYAITTVLRNAFIQALYPSLVYQINIASVEAEKPEEKKGLLERIFTREDESKNTDDKGKNADDDMKAKGQ